MIYDTWRLDVLEKGIPATTEAFRIEDLLTSPVEISEWASQYLPTDELSV